MTKVPCDRSGDCSHLTCRTCPTCLTCPTCPTHFVALVCGLVLFVGCRGATHEDWLAEAQTLCQGQQWDAAVPLLRRHLLERHPDVHANAAAHFHLGRCYLNGTPFYPGAAEGELQTALHIFLENGKQSPIEGYSDDYFELRCHLELAKVYLRLLMHAARLGASPASMHGIFRQAQQAADNARRLDPDSDDVRELQDLLDSIATPPPGPPGTTRPRMPHAA